MNTETKTIKATHTPGPWMTEYYGTNYRLISADDGRQIGKLDCDGSHKASEGFIPEKEAEANAALIASAPELLEACKWALPYLKELSGKKWTLGFGMALSEFDKVIAKAEGR